MEKPDGVFGTGVSFEEMREAVKRGEVDSQYLRLLLEASVEKLRCIGDLSGCGAEIHNIIYRPEWIEEK